tara:strand:- start:2265 stop:4178 length:1914 start_codon:yes stop_codon:yes gene_type:complete
MKIAYKHILNFLEEKPSIENLSNKLFQLGHEHEVDNGIFDMEFTPNRGDCLSLLGLARDLNVFYNTKLNLNIFNEPIPILDLDFLNQAPEHCPDISFLKIEIKDEISEYKNYLEDFFNDLQINKNNFFTDVSNYIAYETGQPTHSYDLDKIKGNITLKHSDNGGYFKSLIPNKSFELSNDDLVFTDDKDVINLAGIMGGLRTACSDDTRSVLVECAYFKPESIIGKAVKYDLHSDASHKFERGVDPLCHENILRRFIQIVSEHVEISKIGLYQSRSKTFHEIELDIDHKKVNNILGTDISIKEYINSLTKLGFEIDKKIKVPSYRSDISHQNDLAEELARVVGYNNIAAVNIDIPATSNKHSNFIETKIKAILIDNGFYEIINSPFVNTQGKDGIKVDNPLDSNRAYLRTNITDSLVDNLLFNERRQKDSIKLFEISDVYLSSNGIKKLRKLSIIASGRAGKNYEDFSKKINKDYLNSIFQSISPNNYEVFNFKTISRDSLDTKIKSEIFALEIEIDEIPKEILEYIPVSEPPRSFAQYKLISEFPTTYRDLSFSIKDPSKLIELQEIALNYKDELLRETFIFDYYENKEKQEIKLGVRFLFQSQVETLTDEVIDKIIFDIANACKALSGIDIPGLN